MTDYSTLKVIDLKKVLKERSLPVSGNKADLIQRLVDADEAEAPAAAAPESNEDEPEPPQDEPEPEPEPPQDGPEPSQDRSGPSQDESRPPQDGQVSVDDKAGEVTDEKASKNDSDSQAQNVPPADQVVPTIKNDVETQPAYTSVGAREPAEPSPSPAQETTTKRRTPSPDVQLPHTDTIPAASNGALPEGESDGSKSQVLETRAEVGSSAEEPATASEETAQPDQSARRKRSHTPTPDESDVRKKLKTADGEMKVILPEDSKVEAANEERAEQQPTTGDNLPAASVSGPLVETGASEVQKSKQNEDKSQGFGSQASGKPVAEPSEHPPTSTLYVRNLKRPLQPAALRAHLSKLAQTSPEDQDILQDFWIDSVRTHCFARFADSHAASRARDRLHNQRWPDDSQRESLWVDYIPDDSLREFIGTEENSNGSKRWHVEYENVNGEVTVKLSDGSKPEQRKEAREEVVGKDDPRPAKNELPARDDRARGFRTLNDLFQSTTLKPILYYQPVSKGIAESRLDRLAVGRGGGRGSGQSRYTFEGNDLVDEGPDNGLRLDRPRGFVGVGNYVRSERVMARR